MSAPTFASPRNIVVLASGSGTNLQVLIDDPDPSWRVVAVISDRPGVRAIARAEAAGIPAAVVEWASFGTREAFTAAVCDRIESFAGDYVVLAGFMKILSAEAIERFPNRIINVHPSLLPAFPGANAVRDALDHGVKVTGVTIHFVDEQLDHGPIIRQHAEPVLPGDDEGSLHRRIQEHEHRLLPEAVGALARGDLEVAGRIVKGRVSA